MSDEKRRAIAIGESLCVSLIWASSFIFVKVALEDLGPLSIAGLRYFLGFLILLPLLIRRGEQSRSKKPWLLLFAIGISAYVIGNGALFWGLKYLPATTVSFLMSLSPLLVLIGGVVWLNEIPTWWQVLGVVVSLLGSGLFFSAGLASGQIMGIVIVLIGLLGFMAFSLLGREIAGQDQLDTLTLTTIPLAFGGGVLLLIAIPFEGIPSLSLKPMGIVLWLAVVNTALGYLLYNHALRALTALEMNMMLKLTPLGTALLAWWLLGEKLTLRQIVGMLVMIAGVVIVQAHADRQPSSLR